MTKYADELADMHPRSWLSKYRKTSPFYLLKMGVFYVVLGNALAVALAFVLPYLIPGYQEPSVSVPIVTGVFAGPSEETLFYGIPFYLSGNPYVVLVTGIAWSSLHILNTTVFQIKGLAYANYLGTIPWIFFTLRVWISGKGWFSIIFHSAYDVIVLGGSCSIGQNTCSLTEGPFSSIIIVGEVIFSAILLIITYLLYRRRRNREIKKQSLRIQNRSAVANLFSSVPKRPKTITTLGIAYIAAAIVPVAISEILRVDVLDTGGGFALTQIIIAILLLSRRGGRGAVIIISLIDAVIQTIILVTGHKFATLPLALDFATIYYVWRPNLDRIIAKSHFSR